MRAPIPSNERTRLEALRGLRILDTAPDARLDEILSLVTTLFGVPMAAISLVDAGRQWFMSSVGLTVAETPRDAAFAAHTILDSRVLVVSDASADQRFFDNAFVVGEPHVRFYAGSPLLSIDGHAIGSLCLFDRVPRTLDAAQQQMLEVLARQAMAQMRLAQLTDEHAEVLDDLDMARRNLAYLSTHDPLTGLLNRKALTDTIDGLAHANAVGSVSTALLFIDLDHFKDVNESYGHDGGDRALVTIADRIHLGARGDDAVARLAGDQFVVVIPNAGTMAPETLARRLLQAIAIPVEYQHAAINVTASVGIVRWSNGVLSAADLLHSADAAMHYAKAEGRNRYVTLEDRVVHHLARRLDAHVFVRHVVTERSMRLELQPLWSLSSGTVIAHEALLRWDSPGAPTIEPAEFLAAAEDIGLVGEITRFTIHEGCRLAARRRQAGEQGAAISVNLSSVQLERDEVLLVVATALNDSGLEPSGLILELTDSAKLAESGSGQATLRELQHMGVQIALDDVGAGFSSLALLRSFPFDFMKIDRSIATVETEADRDALRSLVQLGHSLGMMVVAEGIKGPEVLEQLRLVGCDVDRDRTSGPVGRAGPPRTMAHHPLIAGSPQVN